MSRSKFQGFKKRIILKRQKPNKCKIKDENDKI